MADPTRCEKIPLFLHYVTSRVSRAYSKRNFFANSFTKFRVSKPFLAFSWFSFIFNRGQNSRRQAHTHTCTQTRTHTRKIAKKLRFTYVDWREFSWFCISFFFICLRIHKYICNMYFIFYTRISVRITRYLSHLITRERINVVVEGTWFLLSIIYIIFYLSLHTYIYIHALYRRPIITNERARERKKVREKERAKERESEREREMNLRGGKVKKSAFFKKKKEDRSFRFCINLLYNIICIHSIFLIYIIILYCYTRAELYLQFYICIYTFRLRGQTAIIMKVSSRYLTRIYLITRASSLQAIDTVTVRFPLIWRNN